MRCERGVAEMAASLPSVGQSDMQLEEEAHGVRRKMQQRRQQMKEFNGDVAATAGMGAQGDAFASEGLVPF